jgi:putative redox protein
MTLLMYARRKGWDLQEVAVELTHDRLHAQDCAECEEKEGKVEVIRRHISVRGQIDDGQRDRLLEIAQRCPVHRTLQSQPKVFDTISAGV